MDLFCLLHLNLLKRQVVKAIAKDGASASVGRGSVEGIELTLVAPQLPA